MEKKKEIWIIDDDFMWREILSREAKDEGLNPREFGNPEEAMDELIKEINCKKIPPSGYLCDMRFNNGTHEDRDSPFEFYFLVEQNNWNPENFYFISSYLSENNDIPRLKRHNLLKKAYEKDYLESLFRKIARSSKK